MLFIVFAMLRVPFIGSFFCAAGAGKQRSWELGSLALAFSSVKFREIFFCATSTTQPKTTHRSFCIYTAPPWPHSATQPPEHQQVAQALLCSRYALLLAGQPSTPPPSSSRTSPQCIMGTYIPLASFSGGPIITLTFSITDLHWRIAIPSNSIPYLSDILAFHQSTYWIFWLFKTIKICKALELATRQRIFEWLLFIDYASTTLSFFQVFPYRICQWVDWTLWRFPEAAWTF